MLRSQILQFPGLFCWELHGLVGPIGSLTGSGRFFSLHEVFSHTFGLLTKIYPPLKTNMDRKFWWLEVGRWFFCLFKMWGDISFQGGHTFFQQKNTRELPQGKLKRIIPNKGEDRQVPFLWGGGNGGHLFFWVEPNKVAWRFCWVTLGMVYC